MGKQSIPGMDGNRIFYFTYDTGDGEDLKAEKNHEANDAIWNTTGMIAANLTLGNTAEIYGIGE